MSFLRIKNIKVAGISACVPETVVRNTNSVVNNVHYDAESFVKSTGVAQRHMSEELTTSDLCYKKQQTSCWMIWDGNVKALM